MKDTQATYPLRLPRSLKDAVERISRENRTSINQFVATAVAEKVSALRTAEYFAAPRHGPTSLHSTGSCGARGVRSRAREMRWESEGEREGRRRLRLRRFLPNRQTGRGCWGNPLPLGQKWAGWAGGWRIPGVKRARSGEQGGGWRRRE